MVGKILREKDATVELKISTVLQSIPDWKHYFILQEQAKCDASNFARARVTLADDCAIMSRAKDEDLIQLISSYGGKTLFDTAITHSFQYEAALRHMLEGCVRLEQAGVCHFDLHEGNVVVGSGGVLRLIDFGASILGDATTEKVVRDHQYSFSPEYPPQPPEMSVQNGVVGGVNFEDCIRKTIEEKRAFRLAETYLGQSREASRAALREFWVTSGEALARDWVEFYKLYWRKWDSWAIGVMFLGIARRGRIDIPAKVRPVLRGLLMASPVNRLTAAQGLALLGLSSS
jgi:serine/threonine protein kinase